MDVAAPVDLLEASRAGDTLAVQVSSLNWLSDNPLSASRRLGAQVQAHAWPRSDLRPMIMQIQRPCIFVARSSNIATDPSPEPAQ
jgi:hypothetical protein